MAGLDQAARPNRRRRVCSRRDPRGTARGRPRALSALVLDASAVAEILVDAPQGHSLGWHLRTRRLELHAPSVCDLEVASFLRRELRRKAISASEAQDVAARYLAMPIRIHDHRPLMERILDLRDALTAYDAAYVALAEFLKAPLATLDASVATVARGLGLEVVS